MQTPRGTLVQHGVVWWVCMAGACCLLPPGPARAQPSGVEEAPAAVAPPVAAKPPAPAPASATAAGALAGPAAALDKLQAGLPAPPVLPSGLPTGVEPASTQTTEPPAGTAPIVLPDAGQIATPSLKFPAAEAPAAGAAPAGGGQPAAAAALPEPVSLDHPQVIDTAKLASGPQSVSLFGVVGLPGEAAQGLQGFLASAGDRVTCQAQTGAEFVCLLPDGTDVAEAALINGAARAKDDAPEAYRDQEAAAQAARRGLWSNLPPPPALLKHPAVKDTATLVADGQTYVLDGLQGLGAPYTGQLQGYIAANGDTLSCNAQPSGAFICVLPDGTDIAKVALVNGAALVGPDAPDQYRVQQREALANQRGYWLHPAPDVVMTATTVIAQPAECCVFVAGDDGVDGITYVGGVPTALIAGEMAFLIYGGDDVGWGYYGPDHAWHGAPDNYRAHLDHFHPGGQGLRGYANGPGAAGLHHPGDMHPTTLAAGPGHAGLPAVGHATVAPIGHAGLPTVAHPGAGVAGHPSGFAGGHPGPLHEGHAGLPTVVHPSTQPAMHAGGMAMGGHAGGIGGGGFIRPTPSPGGFHPAAVAPLAHAAPAVHASGGSFGGAKHH